LQIANHRRLPQCHPSHRAPRQLHVVVVQVHGWDHSAGFCSVISRHARSCTCCRNYVYHRRDWTCWLSYDGSDRAKEGLACHRGGLTILLQAIAIIVATTVHSRPGGMDASSRVELGGYNGTSGQLLEGGRGNLDLCC
jgi:hypothetical protein